MTIGYILFLALIQGLTEFLPVSSSGHLALAPKLLHAHDQGLAMDVALHVGTLLAVLVYYRRDIFAMLAALWHRHDPARADERRLALFIGISTIPAVVFGLALHELEPDGTRALLIIIITTFFFGALMGVVDRFCRSDKTLAEIRLRDAFLIGCAQVLALIPGTSRSGITMTAARGLGYSRVEAARFSFLLGIPAIAGAGVLGIGEILRTGSAEAMHDAAIGMAASFVAGLFAISFMIKWLSRYGLMPFAVYRVILAIVLFFYVYQP